MILQSDQGKVNAFVVKIVNHFFDNDCGDICGGDFQEIALECGVVEKWKPKEPCSDNCGCANLYSLEDFENGNVLCCKKTFFLRELEINLEVTNE